MELFKPPGVAETLDWVGALTELDFTAESEKNDYKWKKENGAIVLMDRGDGRRPAMVYMSVPDNLGTDVVSDVLSSLKPA